MDYADYQGRLLFLACRQRQSYQSIGAQGKKKKHFPPFI
jgi:hypothetical protein